MKSNINKYIFTEDLDYSQTQAQSIWGAGDPDTLQVMKKMVAKKEFSGKWLHFAAGDGRYNNILLQEARNVVATDIDKSALEKLKKITPINLSSKLLTQVQNITKQFPFKDNTFNGVFNTGTLHLFPESIIEAVILETHRVLKTKGLFIFDFATDIKMVREDGTFVGSSVIVYSKLTGKKLLSRLLKKLGYKTQFIECNVPQEKVTSGDGTYTFGCNYWFIIAKK